MLCSGSSTFATSAGTATVFLMSGLRLQSLCFSETQQIPTITDLYVCSLLRTNYLLPCLNNVCSRQGWNAVCGSRNLVFVRILYWRFNFHNSSDNWGCLRAAPWTNPTACFRLEESVWQYSCAKLVGCAATLWVTVQNSWHHFWLDGAPRVLCSKEVWKEV